MSLFKMAGNEKKNLFWRKSHVSIIWKTTFEKGFFFFFFKEVWLRKVDEHEYIYIFDKFEKKINLKMTAKRFLSHNNVNVY